MVEQLRGLDAAFLGLESPTGPLQGVGIVRLAPSAAPLGVDELIALVGRRLPRLDVLRRRLVPVPGGLDHPYWVDVEPDLANHIRGIALAPADGPAGFEAFCASLAETPLDRSRPMWEFWLVDGPADGAQALVIKVHHALCDGYGALALVAQLFDQEPHPAEEPLGASSPDEPAPAAPWLLAQAARHAVRRSIEAMGTAVGLAASAGRLRGVVDSEAGSHLAVPLGTPHLSIDGSITDRRSVAFRDVPLDRVKAIAHAAGVHVNDVVLAVIAGALRRWLLTRDELPDRPLVAAVPVSTRTPDQLLEPGNHVSACFVHLPTHLDDPRHRLEVTAATSEGGKAVHAAIGPGTLERLTSLTVPLLTAAPMALYHRADLPDRHPAPVNLVVSDVAGPPFSLYLDGRPAEAFYALGPIFDAVTLNVTAVSYNGVLGFGYVTCPDRLPDLDALVDGQLPAFEELATAFGV